MFVCLQQYSESIRCKKTYILLPLKSKLKLKIVYVLKSQRIVIKHSLSSIITHSFVFICSTLTYFWSPTGNALNYRIFWALQNYSFKCQFGTRLCNPIRGMLLSLLNPGIVLLFQRTKVEYGITPQALEVMQSI